MPCLWTSLVLPVCLEMQSAMQMRLKLTTKAAQHMFISRVLGEMLFKSTRFIQPQPGAKRSHVVWWFNDITEHQQFAAQGTWLLVMFKVKGPDYTRQF